MPIHKAPNIIERTTSFFPGIGARRISLLKLLDRALMDNLGLDPAMPRCSSSKQSDTGLPRGLHRTPMLRWIATLPEWTGYHGATPIDVLTQNVYRLDLAGVALLGSCWSQ